MLFLLSQCCFCYLSVVFVISVLFLLSNCCFCYLSVVFVISVYFCWQEKDVLSEYSSVAVRGIMQSTASTQRGWLPLNGPVYKEVALKNSQRFAAARAASKTIDTFSLLTCQLPYTAKIHSNVYTGERIKLLNLSAKFELCYDSTNVVKSDTLKYHENIH